MWLFKKRKEKFKKKRKDGAYSFLDGAMEILLYIPELILLPFRIVYYLIRIILKSLSSIFDAF